MVHQTLVAIKMIFINFRCLPITALAIYRLCFRGKKVQEDIEGGVDASHDDAPQNIVKHDSETRLNDDGIGKPDPMIRSIQ